MTNEVYIRPWRMEEVRPHSFRRPAYDMMEEYRLLVIWRKDVDEVNPPLQESKLTPITILLQNV